MSVTIGYRIRPRRAALARVVSRFAATIADLANRWAERREAMAALRALDDRTLRDIGVRRSSAWSAATDASDTTPRR